MRQMSDVRRGSEGLDYMANNMVSNQSGIQTSDLMMMMMMMI
jgi:hypothetical protein